MLRGFVAAACVRAASASWPKSPHAARRAAITGEGRELPHRAAHPGAQPHRGQPHRRLQGEIVTCDPGDVYVVADDDDIEGGSHPGSMGNPLVVVSGCPVTVEVAQGKHAFLAIPGFSEASATGALPQLKWEWSVDSKHDETPLAAFSFMAYPRFEGQAPETYFDWYYWPLLNVDDVSFVEHAENFDYYHCYGFCQYYDDDGVEDECAACDAETDLRAVFDVLWVGISTFANKEAMRVTYRPTLFLEESALDGGDLEVVKALYRTNCEPYSHYPADWSWDEYISEDGDARGERDSRAKPYCDWWPDMTLDDLDGVDDCTEIPGVVCDSDGRVTGLDLETYGLRGPLPASLANLTKLETLELDNNRLNGSLPDFSALDALEDVRVGNNFFSGSLACVPDTVQIFAAGRNFLEGAIPDCFFRSPALQVLDLGSNDLDAVIPASAAGESALSVLYLSQSGIKGGVGHVRNLTALGKLDLSRNFLTGPLEEATLAGLPKLYELDLGWNELSGPVPHVPNPMLRLVDLSHNRFTGTIDAQFDDFAAGQDHGVTSALLLDDNEFCGPLPTVFYDLVADSHYFVYELDASRNRFRCAPSGANEYFEAWAHTLAHDFGKCTPVAVPAAVAPGRGDPVVMPGNDVDVRGTFVATTDGKCEFRAGDRSAVVAAFFVDETELRCTLPPDWPAARTTVEVAHHCEDFSSAETLGTAHAAVEFFVANATAPPTPAPYARPTASPVSSAPSTAAPTWARGEDSTEEILSTAALGGVVVAGVVALGLGAALYFIIKRELAGKPLFTPVPDIANPILDGERGGDDDDDDGDRPPGYAPSHHRLASAPPRDVELTADKSADLSDVALVPKASPTEGDILL